MKRSEAVQKLKEKMMEIDAVHPTPRYEIASDLLLKYMEDLGMLPPPVYPNDDGYDDFGSNEIYANLGWQDEK